MYGVRRCIRRFGKVLAAHEVQPRVIPERVQSTCCVLKRRMQRRIPNCESLGSCVTR